MQKSRQVLQGPENPAHLDCSTPGHVWHCLHLRDYEKAAGPDWDLVTFFSQSQQLFKILPASEKIGFVCCVSEFGFEGAGGWLGLLSRTAAS